MKTIKIAYLGGGSKLWARSFMQDLAVAQDIRGEVSLYDIDREAALRNQVTKRRKPQPSLLTPLRTAWRNLSPERISC